MKFTFNPWMFVQGMFALALVFVGYPYIGVVVATIRIKRQQHVR